MLLALDLDGTLLTTDKRLSARNLEAVSRAQQAGTTIVLASGRHPRSMARFADALHLRERGGYVVAFNGAQLIDYASGRTLFSQHLPAEAVPRLVEWARRYDLPILSFRGDTIITEHPDDHYVVENAANNRLAVEGVDDLAAELLALYPVDAGGHGMAVRSGEGSDVAVCSGEGRVAAPTMCPLGPPAKCLLPGPPELLPEVEAAMRADLEGVVDVYRSAPHYLELVPLGVNKGNTLGRLLSLLGRTCEDLIACGDQDNDISMIRLARLGVAMGNAAANVQAAAEVVAPTCDEDGVAHIIERYLL